LRGKTRAIPANLPPQIGQAKFLNIFRVIEARPGAIGGQRLGLHRNRILGELNRRNSGSHGTFWAEIYEKGIKTGRLRPCDSRNLFAVQ
jgi:hypothetical protein